MKVYVVTTGQYSDYTIRGIFSTPEAAEKAVRAMIVYPPACCCDPNPIQEIELDTYQPFDKYLTLYYHPSSGKISHVRYNDYKDQERIVSTINPDDIYMVMKYSERFMDHDVLEKAARDRYMQWKAEQEDIV